MILIFRKPHPTPTPTPLPLRGDTEGYLTPTPTQLPVFRTSQLPTQSLHAQNNPRHLFLLQKERLLIPRAFRDSFPFFVRLLIADSFLQVFVFKYDLFRSKRDRIDLPGDKDNNIVLLQNNGCQGVVYRSILGVNPYPVIILNGQV
ncbi:MAG: hypothetical protein C0490_13240 [Marivirga sp.]|nr:hypothetical protein [Marivirga sp.]